MRTQPETSKVYIGCDSFRHRNKDGVWFASYTTVVVVHINGRNGCKVFGQIETERDFDTKKSKPALRLMNEVYRAVSMLEMILPIIGDRHVEIHVDINPNKMHGSSCVVEQAIGYVRGVVGMEPKIKPEAFAASSCADFFRTYTKPDKPANDIGPRISPKNRKFKKMKG